jgi:hypothetical protein
MHYAAWYAHMYTPDKDGHVGKDAYEQILTMPRHHRRTEAERMLAGPRLPEGARHLFVWAVELRRGTGAAPMGGLAPLTWASLDSWSRFTGHEPNREEVGLLFELDAALRNPPEEFTLAEEDEDDG